MSVSDGDVRETRYTDFHFLTFWNLGSSIPLTTLGLNSTTSAILRQLSLMTRGDYSGSERLEWLLLRLRRALRVVGRLHLPQFEHAVEHGKRPGNNEKRAEPLSMLYAPSRLAGQ